jgi:biopolymer transport protein ExbD
MSRMRRKGALQQSTEAQLELRPLMNVIIVLIPMLLLSAVFMEIRAIEMTPPPSAHSAVASAPGLDLVLRVQGSAYVIEGRDVAAIAITRQNENGAPTAPTVAALNRALASITAAHPDAKAIRILAEPGTRYQEIVSLMDLARAAGLTDTALEGANTKGA